MPPKTLPACNSRPKNARTTTPNLKAHLNKEDAHSRAPNHVRQSASTVDMSENDSSEEHVESRVSKAKSASTPLTAEHCTS